MDKRTNKKIIDFVNSIEESNIELVKAYLFGSYAKHKDVEESDIDVALVFRNLSDDQKFDLQVQFLLMASGFDSRIEPHLLSVNDFEDETPFAVEILKTGIEILPDVSVISF